MHRSTLLAACAALLAAAPLAAQGTAQGATLPASSTKGFFIGIHSGGSSISADDLSDDTEAGGGGGIQIGYGFTPQLALFVEGTGAVLDTDDGDIALGHADIGVRYAFTSPTRRWVPHLEAALSGRGLAQDDAVLDGGGIGDVSMGGVGFTLGGGVQYYAAPQWAIGAALKWTTGEFSEGEIDDVKVEDLDIDATSLRLNLGVTWYPMIGR